MIYVIYIDLSFYLIFYSGDLNPILLWFNDSQHEKQYESQADTEFHYYMFYAWMIFVVMGCTQITILPA